MYWGTKRDPVKVLSSMVTTIQELSLIHRDRSKAMTTHQHKQGGGFARGCVQRFLCQQLVVVSSMTAHIHNFQSVGSLQGRFICCA